jgi:isopenicillin-N epimerase
MRPGWPTCSAAKKHWPLSEKIVFLNHGSFGACPRVVLEAQSRLREEMEAAPVQFLARTFDARLDLARNSLAGFLGAKPENLVFVTNATTGVNAVVRSLDFQPGDEILTTDHDYNACHNVLIEVARGSGAKLVVAAVPFPLEHPQQVVDAILAAVTPRTRLAMIDHVTSNSALIFPMEQIIRELDARGVDTLVDGAHAPGMLPLDLEALGAAYYTGNLHKWTCAPKGAAFLAVRQDKQDGIQPAVISHGNNRPRSGHTPFQDRFDWAGTHDPTAWLCTRDSIRWLGEFLPGGWPEIYQHHHAMVVNARRLLCDRLGIAAPCPESMIGSIATLPMPGRLAIVADDRPPDPVYQRLFGEFGIELHVVHIGGRRWFRISSHLHNSPDEYRYLADVIGEMLDGSRLIQ